MNDAGQREKFTRNLLPWVIAAAGLGVYLATSGASVTYANLGMVSQLAGLAWPQNSLPPVTLLVTFPLRWLPAAWLPAALGLLAAVGGALTLGLLARTIALLPHDRTQAQRDRERSEFSLLSIPTAWLPPVLAAATCGLQLTFWENSAAGTGEIINALLFAYCVRCLLEFRLDGREAWLVKAAAVYGAGMANMWLMIPLLPAFLAAVMWVKGASFFRLDFLGRMLLAGLAGTALLLLTPLAYSLSPGAPVTFGEGLRINLGAQKNLLLTLPVKSLWVLALTSVLPLLVAGFRWATSFGDNSPLGIAIASLMFHAVHGLFLVAGLWLAFDPPFSPRIYPRQFGLSFTWLPLYILSALSVGYYSGYFLLVFSRNPRTARHERGSGRLLNRVVTAGVWLLLFLVPAGLFWKNLNSVRQQNSRLFQALGRTLAESLPKDGAVVLSDDPRMLLLTQALVQREDNAGRYVFVNTATLPASAYHKFLQARHPGVWDGALASRPRTNLIAPADLADLITRQALTNEIYYLHYSFGYYFERFYPEPHGLAFRLRQYSTNQPIAPDYPAELAAANEAWWKQLEAAALPAVIRQLPVATAPRDLEKSVFEWLGSKQDPDEQTMLVGAYYSRALNCRGASLQERGDLETAAGCFQRAVELNPLNVTAQINEMCNQILRAGGYRPFDIARDIVDKLDRYRSPSQLLGINGPFDEPRFCYQQGTVHVRAGEYHQAAEQFSRVKQMMPGEPAAYLWLAQLYNLWRLPDQALALAQAARRLPAARTNSQADLVATEATAYFIKQDSAAAGRVLETALSDHPRDEALENRALRLYLSFQEPTNALAIVERQLRRSPENPDALNNQGLINIQLQRYDDAIAGLSRLLTLQPTNQIALFNRAIGLLQAGRLDESRRDYEKLAEAYPTAYQIYYGLGEIAYLRKDRNATISNYEAYLRCSPPEGDEATRVRQRLAELKSGSQ